MQMSPYLNFNGQCEDAMKFYEKCLGGKITAMHTYEGTPAEQDVPAEWRKKIIHARLQVGDKFLMGSDAPPERYRVPGGFSVTISPETVAEAERIFHALSENGTVHMPIQKTFFAARFGMFVDRYKIPWMVICEQVS